MRTTAVCCFSERYSALANLLLTLSILPFFYLSFCAPTVHYSLSFSFDS